MLSSALFAAVAALASLASAHLELEQRDLAPGTNYSTSGELQINITQIDPILRNTWCTAQKAQCPLICDGPASNNTCDATSLNWNCTCMNGNTPNISDYQQTVPAFICNQWRGNCVDYHPDDLDGQAACLSVQCGNRTISAVRSSSLASLVSAATQTSTSTRSGGATGSSTTPTGSTTSSAAAVAVQIAADYGSGVVFTGLLAALGLAFGIAL